MGFMKKSAAMLIQLGWLGFLVGVSCYVASCNSEAEREKYQAVHDRISAVDAKIDAMAEASDLKFVPKPIRPERGE